MPLPSGFKPIKECKDNGVYYNIIGVVVLYQEPVKSGGSDWCLNFTLQDDFASSSVGDDSSITCRFFQATPDKFPKLSGVGDVVILRTFKLTAWRHRTDLIGDKYNAGMIVFPGHRIPVPELSQAFQAGIQKLPCDMTARTKAPSPAEQMAVIHMKRASSGSEPQVQQHAAIMTAKATTLKKRSLIKDLEFNRFYEIRAQVVNIYYHPTEPQVDLKVTDYTENKDLYYYGDPEKDEGWEVLNKQWKGPFGYLTINVTLFDANASWARVNVAEGDFVYMRNVLIRMSPANKLEGRLHQDRQNPNQVDIRHLKQSSDIEEINERQAAYEKQRGSKTAFAALQNVPDKPSAKTSSDKKRAKKERQRAEKEAVQQELEKKEREWETGRGGVNTNIRAAFPEVKLSTISEILYSPHSEMRTPEKQNPYKLPFVNIKHRSRVRVVDVFPPELELFAHSTSDPNWSKQSKKQGSKERWEWGFVLLLEDADIPSNTVSEKLRVVVNNDAAQHLLKMSPSNLKSQPRVLTQLENRLFILWGNLMELKTELRDRGSDLPLPPGDNRLQNKPFDACIEEYGCQVAITEECPFGYQRMHKLAQTTIQE